MSAEGDEASSMTIAPAEIVTSTMILLGILSKALSVRRCKSGKYQHIRFGSKMSATVAHIKHVVEETSYLAFIAFFYSTDKDKAACNAHHRLTPATTGSVCVHVASLGVVILDTGRARVPVGAYAEGLHTTGRGLYSI